MKLNLRTKFTTPELLGIIKKGFGSLTSKSQLRHSAQSGEAESQNPAFVEIDSATTGMNALGQKDWLWMLARKYKFRPLTEASHSWKPITESRLWIVQPP